MEDYFGNEIVSVAGNLFSSGSKPNHKQVNPCGVHVHSVEELSLGHNVHLRYLVELI